MLGTALAQMRVAAAVAFGLPFAPWALDRLLAAALATQHEFGSIGADGAEVLDGPALDEAGRREVHWRRFRALAQRATRETVYYQHLFTRLGVDPARLTYADITRVPPTTRAVLLNDPDAFVSSRADAVLFATSTGTTGRPVRVAFSARELASFTALCALGFLFGNDISPQDVVHFGVGGHGIGVQTLMGACMRIGALCIPGGGLRTSTTLARLAEPIRTPGKKGRVSVLHAHPSTLGELVEEGLKLGYRPSDFGIERILTGGEALTTGLLARLPTLFGETHVIETYGMTETFGAGGQICSVGHVHFHPAHALVEVLDPESSARVEPGHVGTLVVTPLPPFRATTLLLRYDTEDLVRSLAEPPTCELRGLPAVGQLLGKRSQAIPHSAGWTYSRDVLEAVEAIEEVPLPARCGLWATAGGVAVELVVRPDTPELRKRITASLEAYGVPLRALRLVESPGGLRQPLSLRCDSRVADLGPVAPASSSTTDPTAIRAELR